MEGWNRFELLHLIVSKLWLILAVSSKVAEKSIMKHIQFLAVFSAQKPKGQLGRLEPKRQSNQIMKCHL